MKIAVTVKPGARKDGVEKRGDELLVSTREPASEGRANSAVIKMLAKHFSVPRDSVKIVSGSHSRKKIIEIA